jgi:DNA-binding MarR family transcriptional regulator
MPTRKPTPKPRPDRQPTITDPKALRALAHPVRWSLMEHLIRGPATATDCADALGESPANCSFHLRTLARYGLVEEAPGGTGRQRPWRLASTDQSWSELTPDPEAKQAAAALTSVFLEREFDQIRQYQRTKEAYPEAWRRAATVTGHANWLTLEEFEDLRQRLVALTAEFEDRFTDPTKRPPGAHLVRVLGVTYPYPPPPKDDGQAAGASER